jgi:DNA-binding NarL/FixJ family response regulator
MLYSPRKTHHTAMVKGVLLVDDNRLMRQALRRLFKAEPEFEVYGEAEHGLDAVDKVEKLRPHLVILDCSMPVMNGLEAAPHILKKVPTVFIILFTQYAVEAMKVPARKAGIHAVVHKGQAATHLIPTAHALFDPNGLPHGRFVFA